MDILPGDRERRCSGASASWAPPQMYGGWENKNSLATSLVGTLGPPRMVQQSFSRGPGTRSAFICGKFCLKGKENCGYHLEVVEL